MVLAIADLKCLEYLAGEGVARELDSWDVVPVRALSTFEGFVVNVTYIVNC